MWSNRCWVMVSLCSITITCLVGCSDDAPDYKLEGSPLTSEGLLCQGPFSAGYRTFKFEDTSRPTMPNGDFEGAPSRVLPTTVWYPAEDDPIAHLFGGFKANLAKVDKPFPLIIYCHGFMSRGSDGRYLAEHLASYGYIVLYTDFPLTHFFSPGGPITTDVVNQPGDVSFLIDGLLALHANPDSIFHGAVDDTRIGVMGVSLGGMTTSLVTFHPYLRDPRVTLAATLAGFKASLFSEAFYQNASVPLLSVHGDIDAMVDYETNAVVTLQRGSPQVHLVTILGGSHTGFAGSASIFYEAVDNPDNMGCFWLMANFPHDVDFVGLLGGPDAGIIESDTPPPCADKPLSKSIRPSRQHELTILAILSFFESHFGPDPLARTRAAQFLNRTLARENPEIRVD